MMHKILSFLLRSAALAALAAITISCATEPPADPELVFTGAFDLPMASINIEASGGTVNDAWLCFDCEERVQLIRDEALELVDPEAASQFFTAAAKVEAPAGGEGMVCLESRDENSSQWLLFELGSGRYCYRSWLDS